jgi:hypothetical protein
MRKLLEACAEWPNIDIDHLRELPEQSNWATFTGSPDHGKPKPVSN